MTTRINTKHKYSHPFKPKTDSEKVAFKLEMQIESLSKILQKTDEEFNFKRKNKMNTFGVFKKKISLQEKIAAMTVEANTLWRTL